MQTDKSVLRIWVLAAIVFCSSIYTSYSQAVSGTGKANDTAFISKNLIDNYSEVHLAQLAINKAADPQFKKIAEQINTDHLAIISDLKRVGRKLNMSIPEDENSGAGTKAEGDKTEIHESDVMQALEKATGKDFEKMWITHLTSIHEAKLADLEGTAGQLSDAELKAVVNKSLPIIRVHIDMLRRIRYKYDN